MKLYLSNFTQNETNASYPNCKEISNLADMLTAAGKDHIAARMKYNHRSSDNFLESDVVMMDLDNTHSSDSGDWKTLDDITDTFPDVMFYYVHSRHHMKEKTHRAKNGTITRYEPREKYHIYFPLSRTYTDFKEYETLMLKIAGVFPYFDIGAAKPAQFFYGVPGPTGGPEAGTMTIDQYIEQVAPEEIERSVSEYANKVKTGEYKKSDEAQKAISRLYSYLGIKPPEEERPRQTEPQSSIDYSDLGYQIAAEEQKRSYEWLKKWAAEYGVPLGKEYKITSKDHPDAICICVSCPWEMDHTMNGAENECVIIIDLGGKLSYLCRHSHGAMYGWKDYRAYYESQKPQQAAAQQPDIEAPPEPPTSRDPLDDFLEKIQGEAYRPCKTGLNFFDSLLGGGVVQQSLILLMAAPGVGKTSLCLQIAEEMAARQQEVVYFNLEMSREQMLAKAISYWMSKRRYQYYTTMKILQGYDWQPEERQQITEAIEEYRRTSYPYIKYNPDNIGNNLERILEYLGQIGEAARMEGKQAPAVVVDYLHLLSSSQKTDIQELIKQAVFGLKNYAKEYSTFVVAIVASNRESNKGGRLSLNSGRDSSNLEYTGDYVLGLNYRDIENGKKSADNPEEMAEMQNQPLRSMVLRVLKGRLSAPGKSSDIVFDAAHNTFYGEGDWIPAGAAKTIFDGPTAAGNKKDVPTI